MGWSRLFPLSTKKRQNQCDPKNTSLNPVYLVSDIYMQGDSLDNMTVATPRSCSTCIEVAAKSLATHLHWLHHRYNLARFRALGLLSAPWDRPFVSGLQRPVHGPLALLLVGVSVTLVLSIVQSQINIGSSLYSNATAVCVWTGAYDSGD
jgi:hypothetical protein